MNRKRGYQLHLSRGDSVLKDVESRTQKFKKILSVLQDFHPDTQSLDCLDIGCSGGIITSLLGEHFSMAIGIDIDQEAIEFGQPSYPVASGSIFDCRFNEPSLPGQLDGCGRV